MSLKMILLTGVSAMLLADPAIAQTTTSVATGASDSLQSDVAQRADEAEAAGEIIVTASRRAERVQDVPLAVQAVSAAELRGRVINNTTDLQYAAPGLTFSTGPTGGSSAFNVRGVGTATFNASVEQSVGLSVDNVPIGVAGAGLGQLIDLNRVEVLRGPQGMLFGKNASAGLISIITNAPELNELSARARLSYGTLNEVITEAVVNTPLGTSTAVRLVGGFQRRDGLTRNLVTGNDVNDNEQYYFRGRLASQITDALRLDISGEYSDRRTDCCTNVLRIADPANAFNNAARAAGVVPGPENVTAATTIDPYNKVINRGISGELNYDFGPVTLTSITAYRQYRRYELLDADFSPTPFVRTILQDEQNQTSQEIRLTSNGRNSVDYVMGLFYYNSDSQRDQAFLGGPGSLSRAIVNSKSYAAFGQITGHVTNELRVVAGARQTHDKVRESDFQGPSSGATAPVPVVNGSVTADNFSFRLGLQYDVADDVMLYGTVSRGYKGPAFSSIPASGTRPVTAVAVQPEIARNYELGLRSQFLDRRLTFNVTAFRTDFTDYQASVVDPVTVTVFLQNAGSVRSQGIELETSLRLTPAFSLFANASFVNSKFRNFPGVQCSLAYRTLYPASCPGGFIDASGNVLPNAPKTNYNLSALYSDNISDRLLGSIRLNWNYRSSAYFTVADPSTIQKGYGLLGLNASIGSSDERWQVSVYARNLLDKSFVSGIAAALPFSGATYTQAPSLEARRTVGVALDVKF
jgi:iron complex outermembrane receptor protein